MDGSEGCKADNENSTIVISANVGNFDKPKLFVEQNIEHGFVCHTANICETPRISGKYYKTQSHLLHPHDTHIWIDAAVEVISPRFVEYMQQQLEGYDVAIGKHPFRNCPYAEIDFIIDGIRNGNEYLSSRYNVDDLMATRRALQELNTPPNIGLYACGIFARRNTPKVNAAFNEWWRIVCDCDTVDQPSFVGVARKHGLKIIALTWNTIFKNEFFKLHSHEK